MESNEAKKYLSEQGYGSGTNYTTSTVASLMKSFTDQKTASQQQTIERLIKGIEWEIAILRDERAKNGWRLSEGKQHSRLVKLLESAQLLNTTETSKAKGE